MNETLTTLPGRIDMDDMMDVLKKAGFIAAGSIAGGLLKEKAIKPMFGTMERADLYATLAELGLGAFVAVFSLSKGPEFLFYPALGVAVHAAGNILTDLLAKTGVFPVEQSTGATNGGNGGVLV